MEAQKVQTRKYVNGCVLFFFFYDVIWKHASHHFVYLLILSWVKPGVKVKKQNKQQSAYLSNLSAVLLSICTHAKKKYQCLFSSLKNSSNLTPLNLDFVNDRSHGVWLFMNHHICNSFFTMWITALNSLLKSCFNMQSKVFVKYSRKKCILTIYACMRCCNFC